MNLKIFKTESEWIKAILLNFENLSETSLVGLAGGATPMPIYAQVKNLEPTYFLIDERLQTNLENTNQFAILKNLNAPNIVFPELKFKPEKALLEYNTEFELQTNLKELDLLVLGMGDDGHIASLFPGIQAKKELSAVSLIHHDANIFPDRLSLNFNTLSSFKNKILIITGSQKIDFIKNLANHSDTPVYDFLNQNEVSIYALS
jgi:6-phosphogluconolactonase/glucosamine-6-phosphate isomerase/deaminase